MLLDIVKANSNIPNREVAFNYNPCFVPGNRYLVKANPLLKDALNNLVDNAIKHNRNTPIIDINVGKEIRNECAMCRVVIEDNGIGIPDSKKGDLFHRFKRGQTMARGTGLGLYIVKTLLESFYGYVEVEDRVPGDYTKGSRFLVYLPVAED
jgi:signal transduction histidine kinase